MMSCARSLQRLDVGLVFVAGRQNGDRLRRVLKSCLTARYETRSPYCSARGRPTYSVDVQDFARAEMFRVGSQLLMATTEPEGAPEQLRSNKRSSCMRTQGGAWLWAERRRNGVPCRTSLAP
jgi:hypothetical protein